MGKGDRAWLRDQLREQIKEDTKSLAYIRAFLSNHPDNKDAHDHFPPYIEEHERTIKNCQQALARFLPPNKYHMKFPIDWVDHEGQAVEAPLSAPSFNMVTSLTLEVYGIDSSSSDWQNSFPLYPDLKHLTLVTSKGEALSIAKYCLEVCPKLKFLTLLWAFLLDWQPRGPDDGYVMALEDLLGSSLGKLKKLELDGIIYKRLLQKCEGNVDGGEKIVVVKEEEEEVEGLRLRGRNIRRTNDGPRYNFPRPQK